MEVPNHIRSSEQYVRFQAAGNLGGVKMYDATGIVWLVLAYPNEDRLVRIDTGDLRYYTELAYPLINAGPQRNS